MTRGLEITLGDSLKRFAVVYVSTFADSYVRFGGTGEEYHEWLQAYSNMIKDLFPELCRMSAANINSYLNLYGINVNKSADEFKLIYFLGRAIEKHLKHSGLVELAQVHMYSMVGLLDFKLRTLGYEKKTLVRALLKLIKISKFDEELGPTGCYLIYKCCSTTQSNVSAVSGRSVLEHYGMAR